MYLLRYSIGQSFAVRILDAELSQLIKRMGAQFLEDIYQKYLVTFRPSSSCLVQTQSSVSPTALAIFLKFVCKSQKEWLFQ